MLAKVLKPITDRRLTSKLVKLARGTTPAQMKRGVSERELISHESRIGRQLFGPVPVGHHREFFCLDEHTWIWYESWPENGRTVEQTTRYEIHPNCILKVQDGQPYRELEGQELYNFVMATDQYMRRVGREIYGHAIEDATAAA